MAGRAYSAAFRAEAVALATVIGADAASQQLGITGKDTLRNWMLRAGKDPADAITQASWDSLMELALARAQSAVASGKLTPVALATVAGIAKRNVERPRTSAGLTAIDVYDDFDDWLAELAIAEDAGMDVEAFEGIHSAVLRELLVRANAERDGYEAPPSPHRLAILSWYRGGVPHGNDPEPEAGDILEWSKAQVVELVATHGSLAAFVAKDAARRIRQRVISDRTKVLWREGGMAAFDAEAFVREHLIDDYPDPFLETT